jgi:hypothetical protein
MSESGNSDQILCEHCSKFKFLKINFILHIIVK